MIKQLRLDGFLSFAPGSPAFDLRPLNVLIGPNGSGKSNVIEALGLLAATTGDLAGAILRGGGFRAWAWSGEPKTRSMTIEAVLEGTGPVAGRDLRHHLKLGESGGVLNVLEERIEDVGDGNEERGARHSRLTDGGETSTVASENGRSIERREPMSRPGPDRSLLAEPTDPTKSSELTWLANAYSGIRRYSPADELLPDAGNLTLVLDEIERANDGLMRDLLKSVFPTFEGLALPAPEGLTMHLIESGLSSPIESRRISDGIRRFLTLLAVLHAPRVPSLLCIDGPESGLHPDAAALLAEVLVEASSRTQLIVATHSDALVSALTAHADSIVTCERPGVGTKLSRVDPDQLASWLEDYTLGDLWRMGVLGANP